MSIKKETRKNKSWIMRPTILEWVSRVDTSDLGYRDSWCEILRYSNEQIFHRIKHLYPYFLKAEELRFSILSKESPFADIFQQIVSFRLVYHENKLQRHRDCAIVRITAVRTCEDRETESRISRATPRSASCINYATRKTRCDDGDRTIAVFVHPAGALSRDCM